MVQIAGCCPDSLVKRSIKKRGKSPAVLTSPDRFASEGLSGWLGHILRAGPSRLIYQAVTEQHKMGLPVNILMDAPPHSCMLERPDCVSQRQDCLESHVEETCVGVIVLLCIMGFRIPPHTCVGVWCIDSVIPKYFLFFFEHTEWKKLFYTREIFICYERYA